MKTKSHKFKTALLLLMLLIVPVAAAAKIKLQVTGTSIKTEKPFDGNNKAKVLSVGTITTALDPEHPNIDVMCDAYYDDSNVGVGKRITVVFKVVNVGDGSLSHDKDYYDAPDTIFLYDCQITRLTLSLATAVNVQKQKVYDGTNIAQVNGVPTLAGKVDNHGDVYISDIQATYNDKYTGYYDKVIIVKYTISGADAIYYNAPLDDQIDEASILPKQLTISGVVIGDKQYDGNNVAYIQDYGELHGIEGNDVVSLSRTETVAFYADKTAADNKSVTVTYVLSGQYKEQYIAPMPETFTSSISKLTVNVTGTTIAPRDYNGSDVATIRDSEVGSLNTILPSDNVVLKVSSAKYDAANAGTHNVNVNYYLSGADAANYQLGQLPVVQGVIRPKQLTISGVSIKSSKVYDGNDNAGFISEGTLSGVVGSDVVDYTATAKYEDKNVGSYKKVTVSYTISEQGGTQNYIAPSLTSIFHADITPKQLYISGFEIEPTKIYDGKKVSLIRNYGMLSGIVSGDNVSISSVNAEYVNEYVGNSKPVYVDFTLIGVDKDNYVAPEQPIGLSANITPKQLTATNPSVVTTKTYDGNTNASLTLGTLGGKVGSDDVQLRGTASYEDENVGGNKLITVVYSLTGNMASNYIVPENYTTTGSITKSTSASVVPNSVKFDKSKTYDGTTDIVVTDNGKLQNVNPGDDVRLIAKVRYVDADAGNGKTIFIEYELEGADKDNYEVPQPEILYDGEIKPKQLTVSSIPNVNDKVFDGTTVAEVDGTVTLTGLISGDDVTVTPVCNFDNATVGDNKRVSFTFTLDGLDKGNYIAPTTTSSKTANIIKRQLTADAPVITKGKVYDGNTTASVTATVDLLHGLQTGYTNVTLKAVANYADAKVGTNKQITVVYTIDGQDAFNYIKPFDYHAYDGYITQASALTVEEGSVVYENEKEYDGTDTIHVIYPGRLIGVNPKDDVRLVARARYSNADAGSGKMVIIEYELVGADKDNYVKPAPTIEYTGNIKKRRLSIVTAPYALNKVFDGNSDALLTNTAIFSNFIQGDDVTVLSTGVFDNAIVGENKKVTINYTLSGDDMNNYFAPASTNTYASITPLQLVAGTPDITISKSYDGNKNAFVVPGSLVNVVSGYANVTLTANGQYDNSNVGTGKTITIEYFISGANSSNYLKPVNYQIFNGEITTAESVVVDLESVKFDLGKEYDGTDTIHIINNGKLVGTDPADSVTLKTKAHYENADAGEGKIIILEYELEGPGKDNYGKPKNDTLRNGVIVPIQLELQNPLTANDTTFNGSTIAKLSGSASVVGVLPIDLNSVRVVATGEFVDATAGVNKKVVVKYMLEGDAKINYLAPANTETKATIKQKQLKASSPVITKTKEYDGTVNAVVKAGTLLNLESGFENVVLTANASYDTKEKGSNKTITVSYTISGDDAMNYIEPVDYKTHDGVINKSEAISVDYGTVGYNSEKTYDGTNTIVVTDNGEISGANPKDDVSLITTAYYDDKNAGEGKRIIIHYELAGADKDNYDTPENDTLYNGVVVPKQLVLVQEPMAKGKVFDGTIDAELSSSLIVSGILTGLGDEATVTAKGEFENAVVANGKSVTITYSITGRDKDNYTAPNATFSTADIRPLKLTAGIPNIVKVKEYDGDNKAWVTMSLDSLTNLKENFRNLELNATATYNNEKVASNKQITVHYELSGVDAVNYIAPNDYYTFDGEIFKNRSSKVVGTQVESIKNYDGDTRVTVLSDGEISGKGDDDVTVQATANFETPEVGNNKMIIITYELIGEDQLNYEIPEPDTIYGIVLPKLVYVTDASANDKYYDGTKNATIDLSSASLVGLIGGDNVNITANASFSKKNVGYHPVLVSYSLSGASAQNYNLGDSANTILHANIMKKPVSVVDVIAEDERQYNDSTDIYVVYSGRIDGLISGDHVGVVATAKFDRKYVGIRNVIYHFDFIGDTTNYEITNVDSTDYAGGRITAVKPYVVGTEIDSVKVYDGTRNAWVRNVGTLYGFSMDGIILNAVAYYADENVANAIPVTVTYTIGGPNAYNFEVPESTLLQAAITPKTITVAGTVVESQKAYDKTNSIDVLYDGDLVGVCGTDNVGLNVSAHYDDINVGNAKTVSVHYSLTGSKSGNYEVTDTVLTADIKCKQLGVQGTVVDMSKQYDGDDDANVQTSGYLVGVEAGDEVYVTAEAEYGSVAVGINKIINVEYTIAGPDAANYIKPNDSVFTTNGIITKRQLYVSGINLDTTKVYDGNTFANVSVNGAVPVFGGDNVSVNAIANYSNKNVGTDMITVHYLLTGDTANYSVPDDFVTNGSIICKPVYITGTKVDSVKVYDGTSNINIIDNGNSSDFIIGDTVAVATNALLVGETFGVVNEVAVNYYLTGSDNGNYCVMNEYDTLKMNVVINPKQIDTSFISTIFNPDKVYDATVALNVVANLNQSCIVGGDDVQLNTIAYYDTKDVGTRTLTIKYMLSGDDYDKYDVPADLVCQGHITPYPLAISRPVVDEWKMYDGTDVAAVLGKASATNLFTGDQVYILTNASYDNPNPGTNKSIYAHFSTYGIDAANYTVPDTILYSTAGIIYDTIALKEQTNGMKFIPDAVSYCKGDKVTLGFNVISGDPVEYRMEFLGEAKKLFKDSTWRPTNDDNTLSFNVEPRDDVHGVYKGIIIMRNELQQRDDINDRLYSDTFEIRVNMSADAYLTKMYSDVISLVLTHSGDTFKTYQWYRNGDIIPGATLPYYKEQGGLDGVYYAIVNMGMPTEERTCDSPLFKAGKNDDKRIMAYPNPVQDHVTLRIDNFTDETHTMKVVNAMGNVLETQEFDGDVLDFNMDGYIPGIYTITIDELQIKVIKK